jgi:hypothetical protein
MDTIDRKWRQQNLGVDRSQRRQKNKRDDDKTYRNLWYDTKETAFMRA